LRRVVIRQRIVRGILVTGVGEKGNVGASCCWEQRVKGFQGVVPERVGMGTRAGLTGTRGFGTGQKSKRIHGKIEVIGVEKKTEGEILKPLGGERRRKLKEQGGDSPGFEDSVNLKKTRGGKRER